MRRNVFKLDVPWECMRDWEYFDKISLPFAYRKLTLFIRLFGVVRDFILLHLDYILLLELGFHLWNFEIV